MVARIIQIAGSLDYTGYREVEFSIEGRRYGPYKLVASALAEHLRDAGEECAVTLLVPESLVVYVANSPEEAEALLEDRERLAEEARRRLREVVATDFEVMVIQGLGHYPSLDKKWSLEFENSIGNTSSYFLVELPELSDRDRELIFCTSTGHNAYLLAVQMALSVYSAYRAFADKAPGDDARESFVLKTAYHPFPSEGRETPVELEPTHHRAFFDLPELRAQLVTDRTTEAIELTHRLHGLTEEMMKELGEVRTAFNAVRYNAPLVLAYLDPLDGTRILKLLRDAMTVIEDVRSIFADGSTVRVRRFRVNRGEVSGWVVTAALAMYLSRVIELVTSTGGRLKGILRVMGDVYRVLGLGLNSYVLEHEADNILTVVEQKTREEGGMRPGERRLLRDVRGVGGSGNAKRNFFAHAGFLADWTYVTRTEDGDVVLEYDANRLKEIMKWVKAPSP